MKIFKTTQKLLLQQCASPTIKPISHPYVGHFDACEEISMHERLCTFLGMNVVKGDLASVNQDWTFLVRNILDCTVLAEDPRATRKEMLRQALDIAVQTHLFSGFPRVINSLSVIHEINHKNEVIKDLIKEIHEDEASYLQSVGEQTENTRRNKGKVVYDAIYGSQRVFEKMNVLHPAIAQYMLSHGYGTVLSRSDQCPLRLRELCAVSSLTSGPDVSPQLGSHLRGALNVGCTRDQLSSILSQTHLVFGEDAQALAQATFFALDRSRASW